MWCHEFDLRLVETESTYEPPYEPREEIQEKYLIAGTQGFPIKVSLYIDININKRLQNGGVAWVMNFGALSRYMHYIAN